MLQPLPVYGPAHAPEFRDDDQVAIDDFNRGGAPVTVTSYGVSMAGKGGKRNLFVTAPLTGQPAYQPPSRQAENRYEHSRSTNWVAGPL
jgi:hypothetical protein